MKMTASKALGFMSKNEITSLLVVSDKNKNKKNKILKELFIYILCKDGLK